MDLKKTGRLISKHRKELGLTQEQLSEKLFVTPQAVSLWENGQRFPDPEAQVHIFEVLGLNPVELLTGIEMFIDELKAGIKSYMKRINEKVVVDGVFEDEDGFKEYIDLSSCSVVTNNKDGELSGKWISYTDYHNIEKSKNPPIEDKLPSEEYDPSKIYLNHERCFLVIPVEVLEEIGCPLFFEIRWDEDGLALMIVAQDEKTENSIDVPNKVYNGKWKGLHVDCGAFGVKLLKMMGIKSRNELLAVTPFVDPEQRAFELCLYEVKRSGVKLEYTDFLLPQMQYEALWAEDVE